MVELQIIQDNPLMAELNPEDIIVSTAELLEGDFDLANIEMPWDE